MRSSYRYLAPPGPCPYLPGQRWRMENETVERLAPEEYADRLRAGWRRFGTTVFRPRCASCQECRPIRVDPLRFRPTRSQNRARAANADLSLSIGAPAFTAESWDLYRRFHASQAIVKGWPDREDDPGLYRETFLDNPLPTEQWDYRLGDGRLVGVGFVDATPAGLSAIYFYHDPNHRRRSLGTWNILRLLDETSKRGRPHLYLGYYIAGCPSMSYKGRFLPGELLDPDGTWREFDTTSRASTGRDPAP